MRTSTLALLALTSVLPLFAQSQSYVDAYNVAWNTPSADSTGSMPVGNGDIGLNVWTEPSGDIVFYIGKTDAWSETARLLKLGRIRVRLAPNPFVGGKNFEQKLNLSKGEITIRGGEGAQATTVSVWVDAHNPIIRVEAQSGSPIEMQAFYERWRDQQRVLEGVEQKSAYGLDGGPDPIVSYPDTIVPESGDRIIFYHRNARSIWQQTLETQGLKELIPSLQDPLNGRAFGAVMLGDNLARLNPTALRSKAAAPKQSVTIVPLTAMTRSSEEWVAQANALATKMNALNVVERRAAHDKWWDQFWNRSWIKVSGNGAADAVSRGYALQRFMDACAGRGAFPIKYNGSIFTVDAKEGEVQYDADYRRWGGPYWFQNTRLIYWPMFASADFDLMKPFFTMYADAHLLLKRRTQLYFNHEGMYVPETMYFWGAYAPSNYGFNRAGKAASFIENTYIRNYFSDGIELALMMTEYARYTSDKSFVRNTLVPNVEDIIRFYDLHYERVDNKIVFKPAQALETWQNVVNPLPEIAGLRALLTAVQQEKFPLNSKVMDAAKRILSQLPPMPTKKFGSETGLAPAEQTLEPAKNVENPELYAIFPYRIYGVNKPELELARIAYDNRVHKTTGGWQQDAIQAAYLGIAEQARGMVVENFAKETEGQRFPAFWGPNFDWTPDQTHGSVAMMALQSMLLQPDGDRLLLFPAWPKDWDVEFRLAAPNNTVVEGVYRKGKVESLKTTPNGRASNIVNLAEK